MRAGDGFMISIVDYGMGNLGSIQNMLRKLGVRSQFVSEPAQVEAATKLVLPGIGHFAAGMEALEARGLVPALNAAVLERRVPVLGICLGMQLMTRRSEEGGAKGLGWIAADTRRFNFETLAQRLPVPHMGWTDVTVAGCPALFKDIEQPTRFYFVHSYHVCLDDQSLEVVSAEYGYRFTAGFADRNIIGVQFHPEKSHVYGMSLLGNLANL